jgi:hypothetical protein
MSRDIPMLPYRPFVACYRVNLKKKKEELIEIGLKMYIGLRVNYPLFLYDFNEN